MINRVRQSAPDILFNTPALDRTLAAYNNSTITQNGTQYNGNIMPHIIDPLFDFSSFKAGLQTLAWWILEFVPFQRNYQNPTTKEWHRTYM